MARFRLTGIRFDGGETLTITQGGESIQYPEQSATVPAQMAPPSLFVLGATSLRVTLSGVPDDGGSAITGYDLRYSTDQANWTEMVDVAQQTGLTGLSAETTYYVQTRAKNGVNPAPDNWSSSALATTAAVASSRSATITNTFNNGFAPMGSFFEIALSGYEDLNVPLQDCLIVWNFDDAGAVFADHSGRLDMLNRMDSSLGNWNDANKAYGFLVAHVFRNPGTYNVQATVYHSRTEAPVTSNVLAVTVLDPDVDITWNEVYASNGTDFTGVPGGATTLTTTDFNEAWNAVSAPKRIRLKRGDTFTAPTNAKRNIGQTLIEDWGSGAKPIIDTSSNAWAFREAFTQMAIKNVDIDGGNTQEQTTAPVGGTGLSLFESFEGKFVLDNCKITGPGTSGIVTGTLTDNPGSEICFIDVDSSEWVNYGIFGLFYYVAFLGTWVHCNPNGFKRNAASGGGAGYRIEQMGDGSGGGGYFCCTDVFMNYSGKFNGDQPGYKVQGNSVRDSRWVWDRVLSEGSTDTSHGVGSTIADRQFALIDKHIHIGTAQTGLPLSIQQGGTTVRNYFYIQPHVENEKLAIKALDNNFALNINTSASTTINQQSWFYTYGCSVVQWQDTDVQQEWNANMQMVSSQNAVADQVTSNNVFFVPFDVISAQVSDVTIQDGAGSGYGNYAGRRYANPPAGVGTTENGGALQTEFATPDTFTFGGYTDQTTWVIPRPSGANLTASVSGDNKVPIDYIDGSLRGSGPASGAFPPAA